MRGDQHSAVMEVAATERELNAAIVTFDAELWRGDPFRLNRATEAAHAALQAHLDAKASSLALAKRAAGL